VTITIAPAGEVSLESLIELMIVDPRTVVAAAVRLGVFTVLAAGPATREKVQSMLGLDPAFAADFLNALTALRLLERDGELFRNSPVAQTHLDRAKPAYMGEFIEQIADSTAEAWGQLTAALRGEPVPAQHRGGFASGMNADRERARRFMVTMDELNGRIAAQLAQRLDWSRHRTFADLGGARGNLAAVLVRAHPHLHGTCLDVPDAQPFFDEYIDAIGLSDRVRFHPADLLTDPLPAADVLIYGQVLHGYAEPERSVLLRRAAEVLAGDGELVIYDRMIRDERLDLNRLLYSLYMRLVSPTSSEYRAAECVASLRELHFGVVTVEPLLSTHSVIIARR
jgi:hypothetical protein